MVVVTDLRQCIDFLKGKWTPPEVAPAKSRTVEPAEDIAQVRGQSAAKRALEIAAAGGHNLLMLGPPGSGKTMLARTLPGILPPMTPDESLEVTRIYSIAGLLGPSSGAITQRPFRMPHHHISMSGIIGGGTGLARPGEASLAHLSGLLFMLGVDVE